MNAGFSSLTRLKQAIMPSSLWASVQYDDAVTDIGLGVAEMLADYCGRQFAYQVGDTFIQDAARLVMAVPRYPVNEWAAVAIQGSPTDAWEDISGSVTRYEGSSGVLYFRHAPGTEAGSLRVTYTGGYWWDSTEDRSGTIPAGAVPLPMALFNAWTLQVQAITQSRDLFGLVAAQAAAVEKTARPSEAHLLPAVVSLINPYRRFAA